MRVSILVLLVACGGGGSGDIALDNFAAELAEVQCAQIARCCDAQEQSQIPGDCVALFTEVLEEEADIIDIRASVMAGRLEFDSTQAAQCLRRVEELSCAEFSAWTQEQQAATGLACLDMLRGLVPDGEICVENYDCQSGTCDFDVKTQTRRCVPPIPAGGGCDPGCEDRFECSRCEGALLCDPATATCQSNPPILPTAFCDGA